MFGQNPKRAPEKGDGSTLLVQEIFPTVQGEGPHTGVPSIFIRLGGCNLACSFCDTEFEDFAPMQLADILAQVHVYAADIERKLVVITGGEPMRQPIAPLCEALLEVGFAVQIETNGTLWQEVPKKVDIICSPKATSGSYHPIRPDVAARVLAYKYLISAALSPYNTVPDLDTGNTTVFLQPMDEYDEAKNQANLEHCLHLAETHGYKLSFQTHKVVAID